MPGEADPEALPTAPEDVPAPDVVTTHAEAAASIGPPSRGAVHAHEIAIAFRNAIKLGGSLVLTWSVALIVKLQIPAHLGPIRQGRFGFAEGFATMFFSMLSLGIDTYVFKEVPVRPAHASDFMGGVIAARSGLSILVFVAMTLTLWVTGRPDEVILAAVVFGTAQVLMSINATLASVLQAVTHVGRLALANIAAKIIWGTGLLLGLYLDAPMWALAMPMAGSELLKTMVLVPAARTSANLKYRIDVAAARAVIIASFPYFINTVAVIFANSLAISELEYIRHDEREVGWFAACQNIAALAMLLHPLLVWVVMPMLSRAQARSEEESTTIVRRSIEGLLIVIGPATTFISAGSDVFVRLAFGLKYAPATLGLSILSLVFIMTYMNIMLASALIVAGRSWAVTSISVMSIFILGIFMLLFVPAGRHFFGVGGECAGAAIAVIACEFVVNVVMATRFKESPLDSRNLAVIIKTVCISACVLVTNHFIHGLGPARLIIDMAIYVGLAWITRLVNPADIARVVQIVKQQRAAKAAAAAAASGAS
ncbi:MAG TPA: hypothetical protein VH062_30875 [Polyangiaceae bacterium]|nr:hypothetical protein [Polyangiaceae bacterium]